VSQSAVSLAATALRASSRRAGADVVGGQPIISSTDRAEQRARFPVVALLLWALLAFGGPMFAQALDLVDIFAFPLGYFMVAQGALIGFVVIGLASAHWQERRDRRRMASR